MSDIRLYSLKETAEVFGISEITARRRVLDGVWPCTRITNRIEFTDADHAEIVRLSSKPAKPTEARTAARPTRPRRAS